MTNGRRTRLALLDDTRLPPLVPPLFLPDPDYSSRDLRSRELISETTIIDRPTRGGSDLRRGERIDDKWGGKRVEARVDGPR